MTARRDSLRWGTSFALVLAAHAGAVAGMLAWNAHGAPAAPPPAALVIDLAPMVQAPEAPPQDLPPAPQAVEPEPPPPEPEPEPEEVVEDIPEPPPQPDPPAPVPVKKTVEPKPPPRPVERPPEPPREAPKKPPAQAAAPPAVAAPPAEQVTAPAVGQPSITRSNAVPTWQGAVLAHLERHKRYPRAAQARRQQGVVQVAFTLDRQGAVLAVALHASSGHALLDGEALDLLQRAQPLPPPPPEVTGERINLVVPVQFHVR